MSQIVRYQNHFRLLPYREPLALVSLLERIRLFRLVLFLLHLAPVFDHFLLIIQGLLLQGLALFLQLHHHLLLIFALALPVFLRLFLKGQYLLLCFPELLLQVKHLFFSLLDQLLQVLQGILVSLLFHLHRLDSLRQLLELAVRVFLISWLFH